MAARRGAHIGPDGRWWGVPAVREQWNILNPHSWVLIFFVVLVAVSCIVVLSTNPAAPPASRGVLIAWIAMLVSVVVVVATIIATHKTRFNEQLRAAAVGAGADILPICATGAVVRVPLQEFRLSRRQYERFADSYQRRNDADAPPAMADVQEQMQDLQKLFQSGALGELDRARGLAAALRLMQHDSDSVAQLSFDSVHSAPTQMAAKFPRVWLIDAVNIIPSARKPSPHSVVRPVRRARVLPERSAWQLKAAAWMTRFNAAATVISIAAVFGITIVSGPIQSGLLLGLVGLLVLLVTASSLIELAGPRWSVHIEDGELTVRKKGVEEAHPLRVRPERSWLVIYHRSDKAAFGSRLPYTKPIWRFLLAEPPGAVEITNFDYRATAWEPLIVEFLERQQDAAASGPPAGSERG